MGHKAKIFWLLDEKRALKFWLPRLSNTCKNYCLILWNFWSFRTEPVKDKVTPKAKCM